MKYFKSIFKISIILILLIITVGSVSAADASDSTITDNQDDDFDLDEDSDLNEDLGDDSDEDLDDDSDDDWDDEDDSDEDLDDDSDDDWDDDDDSDDDGDDDFNESDFNYTDYDYLEFKILVYLEKYGNLTDENWTESENFLNEYQIYLKDPSNYTLNESLEGYETYVKIYESITSTFDDYNLTENETAYLKFLIIYYLNNYGNVSANYTWNESDDFSNFDIKWMFKTETFYGSASAGAMGISDLFVHNPYLSLNNLFNPILGNFTEGNETSDDNVTSIAAPESGDSWWNNIIIVVLVLILVALVII